MDGEDGEGAFEGLAFGGEWVKILGLGAGGGE